MLTHLMNHSAPLTFQLQPEVAVRLPICFDAAPLLAEISALSPETWRAHFNTSYHDGGWTGVALLTANGNGTSLYAPIDADSAAMVRPTPFGNQCPLLLAAIAQLQCRIKSARILRLAPGSVIREHSDDDLIWRDGEARLHIPLQTSDRVEFYVDGQRVVMQSGECWYLNLSRPHRVQNLGTAARVHLVLDCAVNDWLREQVQCGTALSLRAIPAQQESGAMQFEKFRAQVFVDGALQSELRTHQAMPSMLDAAVTAGLARGLHFTLDDVRAHCNQARRDWIEQWIM